MSLMTFPVHRAPVPHQRGSLHSLGHFNLFLTGFHGLHGKDRLKALWRTLYGKNKQAYFSTSRVPTDPDEHSPGRPAQIGAFKRSCQVHLQTFPGISVFHEVEPVSKNFFVC